MLSCMQPLRRFLMLHENYFDGSSFNTPTAVNMLSSVFLIRYPFGSLVGVICLKNYKLWITMILAGALNTVGVLCRYIGALSQYGSSNNSALSYSLILIGQCISALAFPIIVNLPAAVAAIWFPTRERDMATTLGALFNPVGLAIGEVLPALLVTQSQPDGGKLTVLFPPLHM